MDERESTGIKPEQLSGEEIYARIKKKGEWIIEKNKPGSKYKLERFYPNDWPRDKIDEQDFDIFFADEDGNQKLFKNNLWLRFIEFTDSEKKMRSHETTPFSETEEIIKIITEKMGPDFLNQLRGLARERFDLNQKKKYEAEDHDEIDKVELDKVNEKFESLLEQVYLILREVGTKPGEIRR